MIEGARHRVRQFASAPATHFGAVLFLALLGLAFILSAELGPEDVPTRGGPYGYLLLQAAAVLGLVPRTGRPGQAATAMAFLFAFNVTAFGLLSSGLFGPQIVLFVFDLALLFASGLLAVVILIALAWRARRGPRPPMTAVIGVIVLTLIGTGVTDGGNKPPVSTLPPRGAVATATTPPAPTPRPSRSLALTVSVSGNGSIQLATGESCRATCTYQLLEGTVARLMPQAAGDSIFATWAGCTIPCAVLMDRPRDVRATFRLPSLAVSISGKGNGTVASDPKGISCPTSCEASFPRGSRVALSAAPATASMFTGWSDGCSGFDACRLEVVTDSSATARFDPPARGYQASFSGEAALQQIRRGAPATLSVTFMNAGRNAWVKDPQKGVVLAACCPFGESSPLSGWNDGWLSDSVYAPLSADFVGEKGLATFVFNVRAPANATPGTYRFDAILMIAGTREPISGGTASLMVTVIP